MQQDQKQMTNGATTNESEEERIVRLLTDTLLDMYLTSTGITWNELLQWFLFFQPASLVTWSLDGPSDKASEATSSSTPPNGGT